MSANLLAPRTVCARGTSPERDPFGGVVPAIAPATTYLRDENYALVTEGREYGRDDNPTLHGSERTIGTIEGGRALVFGSGMAAATTLLATILDAGDEIVFPKFCYHGLRRWVMRELPRRGVVVREIDTTSLADVSAAIVPKTRVVWIESPANPTWEVSDIAKIASIARTTNAITVVDSTVATPVHAEPLALGADVVFHSATKYLNGHSDVLAGALVFRDVGMFERVRIARSQLGTALGAFEAWLLERGLRTLFVRVERQSASALALATRLENDSRVSAVHYPGIASFPGHDIARAQMKNGYGGMFSIRVPGGAKGALAVASRLSVWLRATSLGGPESLVEHRATVEGQGSRAPDDLLRLSVGLEDVEDLWRDLDHALGAQIIS